MKIIGNSLFGVGIAISTLSSLAAGQSAEHAVNRTPARWILIYGGGPTGVYPPYTVDSFIDLVAAVDSAGHPIAWLTTGALFLELYSSSGHLFTPWIGGTRARANGADWRVYLDSLYSPGGLLDRLDSAVSIVAKAVGPRSTPYRVAVMIPYPASSTDTLLFSDSAYLMNSIAGRSGAASGYVALATGRFAAAGYHHLALDGFYWLREIAEPEDTAVMRRVATAVHSHGLRYLWIPAYQVIGAPEWRTFGFDEAWHQPNYFFTPTIPPSRVNSAFTMARSWGMGIELEFNRRMFAAPEFHDRLIPYLAALDTAPDLRNGSIAIYDGAGGLVALAQAPAGPFRDLYRRLVRTLGSEPAGH